MNIMRCLICDTHKEREVALAPYANLRGANLRGANLRGANLSGADLSGANLRGAIRILSSHRGVRSMTEERRYPKTIIYLKPRGG